MNSYYLNILNQMGYHVINPNQVEPRICMNSMSKEIKGVDTSNFIRFTDSSLEVNYYKDKHSFLFNKVGGYSIKAGDSQDANLTYSIALNNGDKEICFYIKEMPMETANTASGLIYISVVYPSSTNGKELSHIQIEQHATYGVTQINDRKGIYSERVEAYDCATENYIKWILEAINKYNAISKDRMIQEGLKVIVPSLSLAISDMLGYCKGFALTNEIVLRKVNIQNQEKIKDTANSIIADEKKAIEELEKQRNIYAVANNKKGK